MKNILWNCDEILKQFHEIFKQFSLATVGSVSDLLSNFLVQQKQNDFGKKS